MSAHALAPQEQRERWLTAIVGSFPRIVLWRAARRRYVDVALTIRKLRSHIIKIATSLARLWCGLAVIENCNHLCDVLESLENGYRMAMTWLDESRTDKGERMANWRNPGCRAQREFIIKQMVVFHGRFEQLKDLFAFLMYSTKTFDKYDHPAARALTRSASISSIDDGVSASSLPALSQEKQLRDFIQDAAWTFDDAGHIVRQKYNSGQLFAEYVQDILHNIAAEKALYTQRRRTYPYPSPKLTVSDDEDSEFWQESGPLEQVPMLEDDEHREWLLF